MVREMEELLQERGTTAALGGTESNMRLLNSRGWEFLGAVVVGEKAKRSDQGCSDMLALIQKRLEGFGKERRTGIQRRTVTGEIQSLDIDSFLSDFRNRMFKPSIRDSLFQAWINPAAFPTKP